jgi:hypothetical protein
MSQASWSYGRRHPSCVDCEREFVDGEAHFSLLEISAEADLARVDVCEACWGRRSPEEGSIWWRARRREAKKQGLAIDMEALEAIFHQLADKTEERHRELRYVLCLLLMRKRRLLMNRAVRRSGGEFLLVRRPRRKDEIAVEVFDLAADRLDEIRSSLQRLFEGEGLDPEALGGDAAEGGDADCGGDEAGADRGDSSGAEVAAAEHAEHGSAAEADGSSESLEASEGDRSPEGDGEDLEAAAARPMSD